MRENLGLITRKNGMGGSLVKWKYFGDDGSPTNKKVDLEKKS